MACAPLMNFFGHACLAARRDSSAGFVFGEAAPHLPARTLTHRPRLALTPSEVRVASDWAQHFTPRIQSVAEPWLREIEAALGED